MIDMKLISQPADAIDLLATPIHLGLGSRAMPIDGFAWDPDVLEAYSAATAEDGDDGRLVMIFPSDASWTHWERHPAGEEVVICLSGRMTVRRQLDGGDDAIDLGPGEAMINPRNVWHTADVTEPGRMMAITPGAGTEHRAR